MRAYESRGESQSRLARDDGCDQRDGDRGEIERSGTMKFSKLWTLVWKETGTLVPGFDDGADGMLILNEEDAKKEAERQTEMYGNDNNTMMAEPVEIG